MNKLVSASIFMLSLIGFIPLLIISFFSGRDIQLEVAETCIKFWNKS